MGDHRGGLHVIYRPGLGQPRRRSELDIWEITDGDAFRPLHVFDDKKDIGYRIEPRSTERWRPGDGYFKPPVSDER